MEGSFGFGQMIEVIGVFAQIDEPSIAGAVRWIRPRHDKDRIVCGTLCGPFREHLPTILASQDGSRRKGSGVSRRKRSSVCSAQ